MNMKSSLQVFQNGKNSKQPKSTFIDSLNSIGSRSSTTSVTIKPTSCEEKRNDISKEEKKWNQNYEDAVYYMSKLFDTLVVKMDAPGRVEDWLQEVDRYLTHECRFEG